MLLIFILLISSTVKAQQNVPTSIVERILGDGYPLEIHDVITEDGYILQVHRIPQSPVKGNGFNPKGAVFMQHGYIGCSDNFVISGPHKALAYMVADAGYDVWLGNFRGNTYSKRHKTLNRLNPAFWDFALYEHAIDLRNTIDYILMKTSREKLHFVGHSVSSIALFIMLSERPEYNSKISSANLFAPVLYYSNAGEQLLRLFCPMVGKIRNQFMGNFEILPHIDFVGKFLAQLCDVHSPVLPVCVKFLDVFCGISTNFNKTLYSGVVAVNPAGSSIKAVENICQGYNSGILRKFDYGPEENYLTYGSRIPPEYNLENTKVNLYLYVGNSDAFVNETDFEKLVKTLKSNVKNVTYYKDQGLWAHDDFIFGNNVDSLVNPLVIERINENN